MAFMSVGEVISRRSQPGMQRLRMSGSFSAAQTLACGAGTRCVSSIFMRNVPLRRTGWIDCGASVANPAA